MEKFVENGTEISLKTLNLLTALATTTGDLLSTCKVSSTNDKFEENLVVLDEEKSEIFQYQNFVTCRVCHVSHAIIKIPNEEIHVCRFRFKSAYRKKNSQRMLTVQPIGVGLEILFTHNRKPNQSVQWEIVKHKQLLRSK